MAKPSDMQVSLTLESLRPSVPAIFATRPAPGVSDRYSFCPTITILETMLSEGWQIHRASQQFAAGRRLTEYGCHSVTLRHPDLPSSREGTVEFSLLNSHDRSRQLFTGSGIYRKVCKNGLIAMVASMLCARKTHIDNILKVDEIMEAVGKVAAEAPKIMGRVHDFQRVTMPGPDRVLFATEALATRYGKYAPTVSTDAVLRPRRKVDEGDSLWLVLNRVQENLMTGTSDGKRNSKPIVSLVEQLRVNRKLWEMAEQFASQSKN